MKHCIKSKIVLHLDISKAGI